MAVHHVQPDRRAGIGHQAVEAAGGARGRLHGMRAARCSTGPKQCEGEAVNVTLDVFSALIDSRTGGSRVFDQIAQRHRWALHGQALYRAWDREHKRLQRECVRWEPFTALAARP